MCLWCIVANRNVPTCILCRAREERAAIRIGVWLCKRHWRLVVRLVKLLSTKLVWHDAELRDTYTRVMRPQDYPTDVCMSQTKEAKLG